MKGCELVQCFKLMLVVSRPTSAFIRSETCSLSKHTMGKWCSLLEYTACRDMQYTDLSAIVFGGIHFTYKERHQHFSRCTSLSSVFIVSGSASTHRGKGMRQTTGVFFAYNDVNEPVCQLCLKTVATKTQLS